MRALARAAGNGAHIPELMRSYFAEGDDGTVVWWMTDAVPVDPASPFLQHSLEFGAASSAMLSVTDPFGGREPQRIDASAAAGGEAVIPFRPTLLLDSQTVTYLHQFVSDSPRLSEAHRQMVDAFLRFALKRRLDFNPMFYFLEALRSGDDRAVVHATATARSMLRLHTMDVPAFLATGRIDCCPTMLEPYRDEFHLDQFDEIAAAFAHQCVARAQGYNLARSGSGELTYAVLLTIASIHRHRPGTSRRDIAWKCARFNEFLSRLGVGLAFERMVALFYFAGYIDRFLPVQRGANAEHALRRIRAAVWDVEFLRIPATWLALPPVDGVVVAYPCTADRTLAFIADSFTLELVCVLGGTRPILPAYVPRDPELRQIVWETGLFQHYDARTEAISPVDLARWVGEGEAAIRRACA